MTRPYPEPRIGVDGRHLCNVVANCDEVAVANSAYECSGCDDVAAQHSEAIARLTEERGHHERAMETVRVELRRRADDGEDGRLSAVEEVALRLGMDKVQQLGATIEGLKAAHAAVLDEHTHPVFACTKHKQRLPKTPASLLGPDDQD